MSFGGAMLALSAVSAVSQISQGYAQKAEANYNASLFENKAKLIDVEKNIEYGQYQAFKGKSLSQSISNIAGAGIAPQGSAMAVILETQRQINIDQAIGQFNYEMDKYYTLEEANQARRSGKSAVSAGYSNAFSTLLRGASSYASYRGIGQRTSVGTFKDTTFDSAIPKNLWKISGSIK